MQERCGCGEGKVADPYRMFAIIKLLSHGSGPRAQAAGSSRGWLEPYLLQNNLSEDGAADRDASTTGPLQRQPEILQSRSAPPTLRHFGSAALGNPPKPLALNVFAPDIIYESLTLNVFAHDVFSKMPFCDGQRSQHPSDAEATVRGCSIPRLQKQRTQAQEPTPNTKKAPQCNLKSCEP